MDLDQTMAGIRSSDRELRNRSYHAIMEETEHQVTWTYEVWDDLLVDLGHTDNHVRAIAAQLLAALAKSDPELRIVDAFPALLDVTRDPRFVTARHCLQSLWKVGAAGPRQRAAYLRGLVERYDDCRTEKNWSLIRNDIMQSLRDAHDATGDDDLRTTALTLIDAETDPKYQKKYARIWRTASTRRSGSPESAR